MENAQEQLKKAAKGNALPRHIAIIMDGNGRWAKKRGLPRSFGHKAGVEALRDIIKYTDELGIEALTIYAFSTENWKRSAQEVGALMGLLLEYFKRELDELNRKNVQIRIVGDVDGMPAEYSKQQQMLREAMAKTKGNTGLKLNIALNYGGRQEIVHACRTLANRCLAGELKVNEIQESDVSGTLYTAGLPEVDLLIRTSGEFRLSNFLLWQCAYAEFYLTDVLWPDFNREDLAEAVLEYLKRDRRYGAVKEE